jgi:tRNA A-37 threonylcarbamoyl transferase component Bud32
MLTIACVLPERKFRPAPMPRSSVIAVVSVALAAVYLVVQVGYVRPHLWPAGHGALVAGDARFTGGSTSQALLLGRPPQIDPEPVNAITVREVLPGSTAEASGLRPGDVIVEQHDMRTRARIDLRHFRSMDTAGQLRVWREAYRMGVRDPLELTVRRDEGEQRIVVTRPGAWQISRDLQAAWTRTHISGLLQIVVFITISAVLLAFRASDPTAVLAVLALTLCAVAGGGPTLGGEHMLPPPLQQLLTIFAWTAPPLGFIAVAFAIGYFPRKAAVLISKPWLLLVPFVVTSPMLVFSVFTALFLIGVDAALPVVAWDASNPWLYFGSFAAAVVMQIGIVSEGLRRFRATPDPNERRRIQIAVLTIVPGVIAYAIKDGLPAMGHLLGQDWTLRWWITVGLQLIVLLPAFGLTYVVAVHRVFSPANVLRRSVQYALARNTLTALALLPAVALAAALIRNRNMSIGMLVSGAPLFYLVTIALLIVALRYRDRARVWLDRHFFREAYDAREILVSLASRITYETDPNDLTALVVDRIDTALHPELTAVFVSGVDEGQLRPITVLHGSAPPLPLESGLVTMLRWSTEPLELYVDDERSPARRLPPADQEWLRTTGTVLFVPVASRGSDSGTPRDQMIALIALGKRRSEEPYTAEDRQLLGSIAAQMALALDVARLRQRLVDAGSSAELATLQSSGGLSECPQCAKCFKPEELICPDDGTAMQLVPSVPHVIEKKYRIDRVIGRGGMGAVYRARDMRLDRAVARKVVRADLLDDPEARTRFRREAQMLARLQHPGIVSVFDYGTFADGSAFLVMELVRGEDLRRVLRRQGILPSSQAVPLLTATCQAVSAAHREGVLHRDLKPENILLLDALRQAEKATSTPAGDALVKVLDFGVAKLVADRPTEETGLGTLTGAGVVVGTPAYMAPEQLRAGPVDARTDVFSLGVIAYEMLTGELPFGRSSLLDIGLEQTKGMKPMPATRSVPAHVERAVDKALSLEPSDRPSSASEFAMMLAGGQGVA